MNSEDELKQNKLITYAAAATICFIFLSLSTCTVLTGLDDVDEQKAEAMVTKGQLDLKKQELDLERDKMEKIESLISRGTNPVAARCAIGGFADDEEASVCKAFVQPKAEEEKKGVSINISTDKEK